MKEKKLTIATALMNGLFQTLLLLLEVLLLRRTAETAILTWSCSESLHSCERRCSWKGFFAYACIPQWSRFLYKTANHCIPFNEKFLLTEKVIAIILKLKNLKRTHN